jgi:predicted MFS family arabinose efflux permease
VVGGVLADRYGNYPVILGTTALSIIPLYLFPLTSGALLAILIAATGFLNVAPHSILVTMAQNTLPGRGGLASGILMGSMFTLGGVGILVTGFAADRIGLMQVLQANVLVCVAALGAGVWLWTVERKRLLPLAVKPLVSPPLQDGGADR